VAVAFSSIARSLTPGLSAPGGARAAAVALLAVVGLAAAPASAQSPGGLAAAFAQAARAIRDHQSPQGYWTTPVTLGPSFEDVAVELNVFTPAVIVDMLEPVARDSGLADALARARAYLGTQIEPTGLVRYHGDPGAVPAAIAGCDLPPDADDTALAWRISPRPDPALLGAALREIGRYRTEDGLYRTWLADERRYRCFYTRYAGADWNPPDVAVEMHVYLFLAAHDREAAGRLCEALARRIGDERLWVWYAVAPLLPRLREADLAATGCSLTVPERFLARAVPGQEPYLTQARLLLDLLRGRPAPSPAPFVRALEEGAAGGFAGLASRPPLLFHNALSAFPPHFHWSADYGYALWLRLYVETARRFGGALPAPPPGGAR
jgi:hypothetical protein